MACVKVPATTSASQPDKSTKSDKIVLNPRKRLQTYYTKPGGPENTGNHISKCLREKDKKMEGKERKKAEKMAATKKDTSLKKYLHKKPLLSPQMKKQERIKERPL